MANHLLSPEELRSLTRPVLTKFGIVFVTTIPLSKPKVKKMPKAKKKKGC
jgi:hypothetical protein